MTHPNSPHSQASGRREDVTPNPTATAAEDAAGAPVFRKKFVPPQLTVIGDISAVTAEREVFFS